VRFATPWLAWLAIAVPFAVLAALLFGLDLLLSHTRLRRLP